MQDLWDPSTYEKCEPANRTYSLYVYCGVTCPRIITLNARPHAAATDSDLDVRDLSPH